MGLLAFEVTPELKEIVDHAMASKKCRAAAYSDKKTTKPTLVLVHDQGIYLMSGGLPGLKAKNGKTPESQAVVYAKSCDPDRDKSFWENSRDLVGGDDFAEILDAKGIAKVVAGGATRLFIELTSESIVVSAECVA